MENSSEISEGPLEPFISIIVPTLNEERFIGACLEALKAQEYPKDRFEILIIDNGSQDKTTNVARQHGAEVFLKPIGTVAALRNFGVSRARGEVLAFLDGDCIPDKDWLLQAAKYMGENVVTGSRVQVSEHPNWIEAVWYPKNEKGSREVSYINSGNLIVPRLVFEEVGGFDETLTSGEDSEFCLRAKQFARIVSDASIRVVHLDNPQTIRQFFKRELWHGLGAIGSFRVDWRDKPLFATLAFALLTVMQIFGLLLLWSGLSSLVVASSLCIFLLLGATVVYRWRQIREPMDVLKLFALYYVYYLARSLSLLFLLFQKRQDGPVC